MLIKAPRCDFTRAYLCSNARPMQSLNTNHRIIKLLNSNASDDRSSNEASRSYVLDKFHPRARASLIYLRYVPLARILARITSVFISYGDAVRLEVFASGASCARSSFSALKLLAQVSSSRGTMAERTRGRLLPRPFRN